MIYTRIGNCRCASAVSCFVLVISCWLAGPAIAESPQDIDRLTKRWLDTERLATHVETEWREQHPLLEQRLALLKAEKSQLQTVLNESSANRDDVEARRSELLARQDELEAQQTDLQQALQGLLGRLTTLHGLLPQPLQTQWDAEAGALSKEADASTQLQVALAQLDKLVDFNGRVSVSETPMRVPDGNDVMFKQLFVGVGAAWFVSTDGRYAGIGRASADGWQWQYRENIDAAEISRAVAIFEKQVQADFVHLPMDATDTAAEAQP